MNRNQLLHGTPRRWPAAVASILLVFAATAAHGQQETGTAVDPKALVREAHAQTKTATSLADFTQIIEACETARQHETDAEVLKYINQLLAWTHNRRGELYSEQAAMFNRAGQTERAEQADRIAAEEFETAVALDPNYWKAIHNRGVSNAVHGKLDEAIADFSRTIDLKSSYANAWFNRGEIHYELGNYRDAARDYSQAITLKPEDSEMYIRRGHARFQLQRFTDALVDYNRAVELAPDDAGAVTHRGDAFRSLGQWDRAATDYRRATDLDRDNGHAMQSAAWMMATCPDTRFRNAELALKAAERAVDLIGVGDYRTLDALAAAQANAGQFQQAQRTQSQAIQIAPPAEQPRLQQRLALYRKNQPYREGE